MDASFYGISLHGVLSGSAADAQVRTVSGDKPESHVKAVGTADCNAASAGLGQSCSGTGPERGLLNAHSRMRVPDESRHCCWSGVSVR